MNRFLGSRRRSTLTGMPPKRCARCAFGRIGLIDREVAGSIHGQYPQRLSRMVRPPSIRTVVERSSGVNHCSRRKTLLRETTTDLTIRRFSLTSVPEDGQPAESHCGKNCKDSWETVDELGIVPFRLQSTRRSVYFKRRAY